MAKYITPQGQFTLDELVKANPNAEPSEVRLWFGDQVMDGNIVIIDAEKAIFKYCRNGGKQRQL